MGDVIQFRPRGQPAYALRIIPHLDERFNRDPATGIHYAMNEDNAPSELNPDPFEKDMA